MSIINIKVKRKKLLSQYIQKQIQKSLVNCYGTWSKIPSENELEFWIQQYKIKSGHTEWSEKFQKNIWIEDESR